MFKFWLSAIDIANKLSLLITVITIQLIHQSKQHLSAKNAMCLQLACGKAETVLGQLKQSVLALLQQAPELTEEVESARDNFLSTPRFQIEIVRKYIFNSFTQ